MINPFDVTKAVDFTDTEIEQTFVEFHARGRRRLADPASATNQFLVGAKGGGRTHLMRHMAYPLQRLRGDAVWDQINSEGYIGVYLRASGLNGTRFIGRGLSEDAWQSVFAYYMDVSLVEQLALVLADIDSRSEQWLNVDLSRAMSVIRELPGQPRDADRRPGIAECAAAITAVRKRLDRAINEVAFTRSFTEVNSLAPGELVFQFASQVPLPPDLRITFLIDEFENFTEGQQQYIHSLLREKHLPVTFLIGSRIYGIRTWQTLGGPEQNRRGAEYDWVEMESVYRSSKGEYEKFCINLVTQRLDYETGGAWTKVSLQNVLAAPDRKGLATSEARRAVARFAPLDRPHLRRLRSVLDLTSGLEGVSERAMDAVQCEEEPLVEKLAIHRLYQEWNAKGALNEDVLSAAAKTRSLLLAPILDSTTREFLDHWRSDMLAQLFRSSDLRIEYAGIADLVKLSGYLPRNLLVLLKNIVREASFQGIGAFGRGVAVSPLLQTRAVLESASWYSEDALPEDGRREPVKLAMRRLGKLFERIRFSDKPSEVELVCFSTDFRGVSPESRKIVEACVLHGLLIEHRVGRSARNNGGSHRVFQVHPMLAPLNNLPIVRRGTLTMKPTTLESIFNAAVTDEIFGAEVDALLRRTNAPFVLGSAHQMELF